MLQSFINHHKYFLINCFQCIVYVQCSCNKSSKFIVVYEIFFPQIKYFKDCLKFCQSHPSRRISPFEKNRPDCLQCQRKSDPYQPCWRSDRSDAEKIDFTFHLKHQRVNLMSKINVLVSFFDGLLKICRVLRSGES